jgi:hypothetical protein
MTFQRWMQEVDDICIIRYLMSVNDLPDMPFYDAFSDGLSPDEFIEQAIPDLNSLAELILS